MVTRREGLAIYTLHFYKYISIHQSKNKEGGSNFNNPLSEPSLDITALLLVIKIHHKNPTGGAFTRNINLIESVYF